MIDPEVEKRLAKFSAALGDAKPKLCRRSREQLSNLAFEAVHDALYTGAAAPVKDGFCQGCGMSWYNCLCRHSG